jgi:hypothetical protein
VEERGQLGKDHPASHVRARTCDGISSREMALSPTATLIGPLARSSVTAAAEEEEEEEALEEDDEPDVMLQNKHQRGNDKQ